MDLSDDHVWSARLDEDLGHISVLGRIKAHARLVCLDFTEDIARGDLVSVIGEIKKT